LIGSDCCGAVAAVFRELFDVIEKLDGHGAGCERSCCLAPAWWIRLWEPPRDSDIGAPISRFGRPGVPANDAATGVEGAPAFSYFPPLDLDGLVNMPWTEAERERLEDLREEREEEDRAYRIYAHEWYLPDDERRYVDPYGEDAFHYGDEIEDDIQYRQRYYYDDPVDPEWCYLK